MWIKTDSQLFKVIPTLLQKWEKNAHTHTQKKNWIRHQANQKRGKIPVLVEENNSEQVVRNSNKVCEESRRQDFLKRAKNK